MKRIPKMTSLACTMASILLAGQSYAVAAQTDASPILPTAPLPTTTTPALPAPSAPVAQPRLIGPAAYRALFSALHKERWADAKSIITTLDRDDPMRAIALSQLYLAKNSPRVELFDLLDLINTANWLPDADQLGRLAQKRGAQNVSSLPQVEKLVWLGTASRRQYVPTTRLDSAAQALVAQLVPFVKNDDPAGGEALLAGAEAILSPDGLAEVRQRVAWSYYIENDDTNARRMADMALQSGSRGDWATQAHWTKALSAWRQNDPRTAAAEFVIVASQASNDDMSAAGAYWAARAQMNAGDPQKVEGLLRIAARKDDTFYGLLARETLGITAPRPAAQTSGWSRIAKSPNVRAAVALHDIGEDDLADEAIRRQAELGGSAQYDQIVALTGSLNLPETQLWLAHHGPAGRKPDSFSRFPMPQWTPDGGWRVDPALIFAHALQESGFRPAIVSPAGARGLMQVMPGTANLVAGGRVSADQLNIPSTNMEYGQRYIEQLRDMRATGGLLPKVMAAYNAGPAPVERWNTQVHDGGDPLLFIESLPYYETRAYVNIVMRNYWMYQMQQNGSADALTTMAQGGWPRVPGASAAAKRHKVANGGGSGLAMSGGEDQPTPTRSGYNSFAPSAN
ncbi:MAG: lytic transglycosylase domain-containing protein [Sphingobium sp.]